MPLDWIENAIGIEQLTNCITGKVKLHMVWIETTHEKVKVQEMLDCNESS